LRQKRGPVSGQGGVSSCFFPPYPPSLSNGKGWFAWPTWDPFLSFHSSFLQFESPRNCDGHLQITTVDEAKQFYPLFGLGANVALVFSGRAVVYFSQVRLSPHSWCTQPLSLLTGHQLTVVQLSSRKPRGSTGLARALCRTAPRLRSLLHCIAARPRCPWSTLFIDCSEVLILPYFTIVFWCRRFLLCRPNKQCKVHCSRRWQGSIPPNVA
jgi:TLC ATP/ADP transporter